MSETPVVLIVDDDRDFVAATRAALTAAGLAAIADLGARGDLPAWLGSHHCALLILAVDRRDEGARVIDHLAAHHPEITVVAVCRGDDPGMPVTLIQHGAYDCLAKPVVPEHLVYTTLCALGRRPARRAPMVHRRAHALPAPSGRDPFADLVTVDPAMREIFSYLRAIAGSGEPLLITGETGTGKDLVARAVHSLGGYAGEYVAVNVAGMDDAMFADTLFGHRRGAFTGATDLRPGLILRASNGTLLLDEIGDLSLVSQVKLLRLLQDGEYYPLGSDRPKYSTARIIAATSADLGRLRCDRRFRDDLYFRLRTHVVDLPPLRARRLDAALLIRHFVATAAEEAERPPIAVPPGIGALIAGYPFPGNVRELRALVYDAVHRTPPGAALCLDPFHAAISTPPVGSPTIGDLRFPERLPTLAEMQDLLVQEALRRSNGNQAAAASCLGISRQALHQRLKQQKGAAADGGGASEAAPS